MKKFAFAFIDGEHMNIEADTFVLAGESIALYKKVKRSETVAAPEAEKLVCSVSLSQLKYWTVLE